MLLITPVISSPKKNYPDVKIDALFYQNIILTLSGNPEINALYDIKNEKVKASEKVTNSFYLVKVLCVNKYGLIVNLTDQWMVAIPARLLNARVKISQGYHHWQSAFWHDSLTHLMPLQGGNMVESNLSALMPSGLESLVRQTTMSYPSTGWKRMRRELDHAGIGQNYVVIQPTARQIFKCWNDAKLSAVIDVLYTCGYEVVLTFGPGRDDLAHVNETVQGCQTSPVTTLTGEVTLSELGALTDHAQLLIGVGSAPAHIAAVVNTPLISLFGTTDHIFWCPWSNNMIQFWVGGYREMPTRDQRDRNEMYLSAILAADVTAAVDKLLPSSAAGTLL